MVSIARTIFGRLHEFDPAEEENKLRIHEDEPQHGDLSLSVSTTVTPHSPVLDNVHSPVAHGEEANYTSPVKQDSTADMANTPDRGTERSAQSISVPRPCGFKYMSHEQFSYVVYCRRASCSLGAPSGACEYS